MKRVINLFSFILLVFLFACSDDNPSQPVITENKLEFCEKKCLDNDCKNFEFTVRDTFGYYQEATPRVTLKDILPKNSGIWVVILDGYDTVYSSKSFPPDTSQIKFLHFRPISSKFDKDFRGFAFEIVGATKTLIDSCILYVRQ